ncbi:hypothetical protein E2C01_016463 [Portunus trituberculatus]|uniref:Uncharacterized protein n=1 Tax=Portunus trituberculatus TaxID=210409 RepID=A0A5B7DPN9_PORTR|nr:hypothetical protein [Portunus trituberculatus]
MFSTQNEARVAVWESSDIKQQDKNYCFTGIQQGEREWWPGRCGDSEHLDEGSSIFPTFFRFYSYVTITTQLGVST